MYLYLYLYHTQRCTSRAGTPTTHTSLKGFARRPLNPTRLNSFTEPGSTLPVMATMGIVTPWAAAVAQREVPSGAC